jgi:hypothetical protein
MFLLLEMSRRDSAPIGYQYGSARGLLLDKGDGVLQITSDALVNEILVFGRRYILGLPNIGMSFLPSWIRQR